jgi:hypothetical protein
VVLGLLLFGAAAFVAMLWFIGSGRTDSGANNGAAHAASSGLTGYSALAGMLRRQGYAVHLSRTRGALDKESLLILTPPQWADGEEIAEIIENRRYVGATILVLPKWNALRVPRTVPGSKQGWVALAGAAGPGFLEDFDDDLEMESAIADLKGGGAGWAGLGARGSLPDAGVVQALAQASAIAMVEDGKGRTLAGYLDDGGCYPVLDEAVGVTSPPDDECDPDRWNLTVVAEPDLFDNYGMADRDRALLASRIIELAREKQDVPIVFDLTLNGLGKTQNLLTLAFTPPFLAATLCLLLAMVVVAWRAFRRFGPPLAEARAIAFGKRRLVANSAGFIQRARRLHLLAEPYAALVGRRLAQTLGVRAPDPLAIDAALARRLDDPPSYAERSAALRKARGASNILRAAHDLKSIERKLTR